MDQRFVALGTGAVLGLALVVGLAFARPYLPAARDDRAGVVEPLPSPIAATDLARHFSAPGRATVAGEPVRLVAGPAGEVVLPSGRLVIADAFFLGPDALEVSRQLPPGEHPVTLLDARMNGYHWPVAALIATGGSVHSWAPIPEASYAGAETGVIALAPAELDERLDDDPVTAELVVDRLGETYEAIVGEDGPGWVDIEAADGLRLYAITTEFGVLAAHWGLDPDGDPVAVLLDFGELDAAQGD